MLGYRRAVSKIRCVLDGGYTRCTVSPSSTRGNPRLSAYRPSCFFVLYDIQDSPVPCGCLFFVGACCVGNLDGMASLFPIEPLEVNSRLIECILRSMYMMYPWLNVNKECRGHLIGRAFVVSTLQLCIPLRWAPRDQRQG